MSIEIKVFLSQNSNVNNLCFHAVIYKKDDYDVFYDLNDTYEVLMLKALEGGFNFKYRERDTLQKKIFTIDSEDYIDNINQFSYFLNRFYKLNSTINQNYTHELIGVRLVGAGYRGNINSPMLENEQFNAMTSMHVLKTALFKPSNNIDYIRDDVYLKKSSGSLKLTLEATQRYNESIQFMRTIYEDIENQSIDPFKFNDNDKKERYQKVVESLNNLNKQKRLKEFYITIAGEEYPITKREYLRNQVQNIYNENIELIGNYQGYNNSAKSFRIRIEEKGVFSCHLEKIYSEDKRQFSIILEKLKSIDPFSTENVKVLVHGEKVKPKTINVLDIKIY